MKRSIMTLALAALALSGTAVAGDIDYNYVEGGYYKLDDASKGPVLRAGVRFADSGFYGNAGYSRQELDGWGVKFNLTNINLGYAYNFAPRTDLQAELGYQRASVSGGSVDGNRASIGVAHAFNPHFQGFVRANHYFGGDLESDTTGTLGATGKFTQNWGLTGEVEFGDGGNTYLATVRYAF
jgi:hypothetical protein